MFLINCIFGKNQIEMRLFSFIAYHRIHIFIILLMNSQSLVAYADKTDSLVRVLENSQGKQKMEVLAELIKVNAKSSPDSAIVYGNEFFTMSADNKNDKLLTDVRFNLAIANIYLRNFNDAEKLLLQCITSYKSMDDKHKLSKTTSQLAYVYYRKGEMNEAYKYIVEAQTMSEKYGDSINRATDMFRRGVFAKKLRDYEEAILYYNKAIVEYRAMGNEKLVANLYGNIGNVFNNLQQTDKALIYHKQALEVYQILGDSIGMAGVLNDIGNAYYKEDGDSLALHYYFLAHDINKALGNDIWLSYNLQNIAVIYTEQEKYEEAIRFVQEAINLKIKSKVSKSLITSYATLGDIYFDNGDNEKALETYLKSLDLISKTGINTSLTSIYRRLADVNAVMEKFEQAYFYANEYATEKDSVFNQEKIETINDIQEKYETVAREKEIIELQREHEKQASRELMLITIIVGIIIISMFLLAVIWLKRKKDKEIHRQKELYHKKDKELAKSELEKSKLKEEELQHSILYKSKQLSTHALHMMQKNSMLQEIQADIIDLSQKASIDEAPNYKRINQLISQSLRSHKDWDVFKLYFEDVNKDFYRRLKEINPELTTNDHRLCALIKLNMNSKEMASVLNVAPNSIKSSRYRLKKKLGLDAEADLEEFIRGLG